LPAVDAGWRWAAQRESPSICGIPKIWRGRCGGIATVAFVIPDVIDMEVLGLNVVSAAQSAGVRRLLWFSSFGASPKNEARFSSRHPVIDEAVRSSGIPYTILRPSFFMQDFTAFYGETIRTAGAIFLPLGDARISHLDLRDLGEAAVAVLRNDRHLGSSYDLSGPEALHTSEVAEQIGSAIAERFGTSPSLLPR